MASVVTSKLRFVRDAFRALLATNRYPGAVETLDVSGSLRLMAR